MYKRQSLQVARTTTGPVEVNVARDTEAMKALIQQFVGAYNEANKFLADQTRYNADTKTSATLQGDRVAVALQGQLRSLVATCLLYTSPSPRDRTRSRMPSSA